MLTYCELTVMGLFVLCYRFSYSIKLILTYNTRHPSYRISTGILNQYLPHRKKTPRSFNLYSDNLFPSSRNHLAELLSELNNLIFKIQTYRKKSGVKKCLVISAKKQTVIDFQIPNTL